MDTKIIQKEKINDLFSRLKADGRKIYAPKKNGEMVDFEEVSSFEEMDKEYIQTTMSAKKFAFPPYEELIRFKNKGNDVEVEDRIPEIEPMVIFGLRPCDARSFAALSAVFSWDYQDVFYQTRLKNISIIGLSCNKADDYCFCTSVDGGPGDTRGSDILLTDMGADGYFAEVISKEGGEIVSLSPELYSDADGQEKNGFLADVPERFSMKEMQAKLPELFKDDELWASQALRCLGCGACAFSCPACACFDIQDEKTAEGGVRLRCWDSCALPLFTAHTSGHNPRDTQGQRWRQRVMHKFSYMPERLDALGCVGCGRCSRACPADMNLAEHLKELASV
jgi:ferredoxin